MRVWGGRRKEDQLSEHSPRSHLLKGLVLLLGENQCPPSAWRARDLSFMSETGATLPPFPALTVGESAN